MLRKSLFGLIPLAVAGIVALNLVGSSSMGVAEAQAKEGIQLAQNKAKFVQPFHGGGFQGGGFHCPPFKQPYHVQPFKQPYHVQPFKQPFKQPYHVQPYVGPYVQPYVGPYVQPYATCPPYGAYVR